MKNWRQTRLTELLGLDFPIIQGPFGSGLSSAGLAAAVANAGGLGSYGAHILSGPEIRALVHELRGLTNRAFNINLWAPQSGERELVLSREQFAVEAERLRPWRERFGLPEPVAPPTYSPQNFEEQLDAVIEARPSVASFVFGVPPAAAIDEMKQRGIVTFGTATTVDEAVALEAAGVDVVVATGSDAGGHRVAFLRPAEESLFGTFALVPQVVDAVGLPVVAAGGIADGRGIAAALTLGAAGVQVGTAFLACDESNASEPHKAALVSERARYTSLTRAFTGRLARGIRNEAMIELEKIGSPPPYPIRAWFVSPITKAAMRAGQPDSMALWCGQSAAFARRRSAAACFSALVDETDLIFAQR